MLIWMDYNNGENNNTFKIVEQSKKHKLSSYKPCKPSLWGPKTATKAFCLTVKKDVADIM